MKTRAYKLIDRQDKWFRIGCNDSWYDSRGKLRSRHPHCAYTALLAVYDDPENHSLFKEKSKQLRAKIRQSIIQWNDSNDWETVYETLKSLDL